MATCKDLMSSMVNINKQDTKWKQSLSFFFFFFVKSLKLSNRKLVMFKAELSTKKIQTTDIYR